MGWILLFLCLLASRTFAFVRFQSPSKPCAIFATAASVEATDNDTIERLRKGVAKMNKVMTPEFFEASPILKQFYTKMVKNIEIRESSLPGAGLGLFAKKPIKANTIVSFYPAHALGVDSESSFVALTEDDQSYFADHPHSKSSYLHCTDQPIFKRQSILSNQEPLYLDVNPKRDIVDGWVSQMINDGATVDENSEEGVLEYYRQTKITKNCIHIPFGPSPIIATVTTKKVKKGDELFTSYGGTYWLGVGLDVHGEEGVNVTPRIQEEINETANDLFASMKRVKTLYSNQLEALQTEFDNISV